MKLVLSSKTIIDGKCFPEAKEFLQRLIRYNFGITILGLKEECADGVFKQEERTDIGFKQEECADIIFIQEEGKKESFRLEIANGVARVYAEDVNGAIYGAGELVTLFYRKGQEIIADNITVSEAPYKEMRHVHLMPPKKSEIQDFKDLMDSLAFLRYNTITIEVGGMMELKRRPEVNRIWSMFCDIVQHKFPGGPHNMQWAYKYWKDAPHTSVADGEIIPQETMREVVTYAKKLGFTVIPEIQSFSHAYYMAMTYRDIAEDSEDVFPDTVCPQNEKSYEILFDIAEEIIDVFEPEIVSIGHDEIRMMGECEKCRDKAGHELLSEEITRVYQFFKGKGIRTAMWAEKLMNPARFDDKTLGGAAIDQVDDYGRRWQLPATYEAIDHIPQDIMMIDWFNMLSSRSDEDFLERNMEVYYGNIWGPLFANWDNRSKHVCGAMVSTWSSSTGEALARNGMWMNLAFTAQMLWQDDCTNDTFDRIMEQSVRLLQYVRCIMREKAESPLGEAKLLFLEEQGEEIIQTGNAKSVSEDALMLLKKQPYMSGRRIDLQPLRMKTDITAKELIFVSAYKKAEDYYHSYSYLNAPHFMETPYEGNWNGLHFPRWDAGVIAVIYEDSTIEIINMTYGKAAADVHIEWARHSEPGANNVSEIDVGEGSNAKSEDEAAYTIKDQWLFSVAYHAVQVRDGDKTVYIYRWENPHPDKKIRRISTISTTHDKEQSLLLYEIAYM